MTTMDSRSTQISRAARVALIVIVAAGFAARLFSAVTTSFHADEVSTLLAAERILETGLPKYPSGVIRTTGGPLLYVEAPLMGLFGYRESIVRLPSVLFSTASILAVFYFTRGLAGTHAGLLAALLVAGDPEAVQWGARAKCYGLVPLLVVATAWATRQLAQERTPGRVLIAAGCAGLMLWTHPLTVCLLPGLFAAFVCSSGRRSVRSVLASSAVSALAVLAAALWLRHADPGLWRNLASDAGFFHLPEWQRLLEYVRANPIRRFGWYGGWIGLGVAAAITMGRRKQDKPTASAAHQCAWGACFLTGLFCLCSIRIWSTHHFLILHPLFAAASACALAGAFARVFERHRSTCWQWGAIPLACTCLVLPRNDWERVFSGPQTGHTEAYRFLAAHWSKRDLILNTNASVAAFLPADCRSVGFSQQSSSLGEARPGQTRAHRYTGVPVLSSAKRLGEILDENPRAWWIVTQRDWDDHLDADTRKLIATRMRSVYVAGTTRVLLQRTLALATRTQREVSPQ